MDRFIRRLIVFQIFAVALSALVTGVLYYTLWPV